MRIIKKEPWSAWCRLCAKSSDDALNFSEESEEVNVLLNSIQKYLSLRLKDNLNLPQRICNECNQNVCRFDKFAKQCSSVQSMFEDLEQNKDSVVDFESYRAKFLPDPSSVSEVAVIKLESEWEDKSYDVVEMGADALNDDSDSSSDIDISASNVVVEMADSSNEGWQEKKENICNSGKGTNQNKSAKQKKEKNVEKKKEQIKKSSNKSNQNKGPKKPAKSKPKTPSSSKVKAKKGRPKTVGDKVKKKVKKEKKKADESNSDDNLSLNEMDLENDEAGNDTKDGLTKETSAANVHFIFQCHICEMELSNWNALSKHCRSEHDARAQVMCNCGKKLSTRTSIIEHRAKHSRDFAFKCEHCDKSFHRKSLLISHLLSHVPKDEQPFVCCKCARRFHCEALLRNHEKVHLPKEERFVFPCKVCHKNFCSKSAVSAHVKAIHFGEKPFVCDQCGNSFASKGILQEHLTVHSDEMPWHCNVCGKKFKTKYRLKVHMDVHRDTPYSCPHCPMQLSTRRTLRMHLVIHKETKAYQCPTCGKAFRRSKDLKNHKNLHTGEKPYVCQFCSRTFANGSNCRSHKRRMHPEELREYEASLGMGTTMVPFQEESESQRDAEDTNSKDEPVKADPSHSAKNEPSTPVEAPKYENGSNHFVQKESVATGKSSTYQTLFNRAGPYAQQFGLHSFPVDFPTHYDENSFPTVSYAPAFPGNSFTHQN